MTVYLIARMETAKPERLSDYGAKAPAKFAKHGGADRAPLVNFGD